MGFQNLASPLSELLGIVVIGVLLVYGGYLVFVDKTMDASFFVGYITLAYNILTPAKAIAKASYFNFDLTNAVMASDAFFPFPDCVEIAKNAGVNAVIQPGGSIKDQLSIDYCNNNKMSMIFTGTRHFKH